jgi:hypothetical protein
MKHLKIYEEFLSETEANELVEENFAPLPLIISSIEDAYLALGVDKKMLSEFLDYITKQKQKSPDAKMGTIIKDALEKHPKVAAAIKAHVD